MPDTTIAGYLVTESDVQPAEGWLVDPPTSYAITGGIGTATLHLWVKDSADTVSTASASIYCNTAAPVLSDLVIVDNGDGTATATWTTDIPAQGSANYGPVSLSGHTPSSTPLEAAVDTAHSVILTGIAAGTNYKIVPVNTEAASDAAYCPNPWPIDGDSNMDCRVNILDLIAIRSNKLNLDTATGGNWKADVNGDNRINILDLIYVRNKLNTQCP